METRIKKFSILRNKIEQEIKILKLQKDNLQKIKEYKEKINKIDSKIFNQSNKIASQTFPDLTSLIHIEQENKRTDLKKNREDITEWNEKVKNKIQKNSEGTKKISDFVPELGNENLIKQQIKLMKKEEEKFNSNFSEITKQKKSIIEKTKKINEEEFKQIKVLSEIKENNNYIENKLISINFWIELKKRKTVWIFWLCLIVILGLIGCLIALLTK